MADPPVGMALAAPTGFVATPGPDDVVLRWTDNSAGNAGFRIQRREFLNGVWSDWGPAVGIAAGATSSVDPSVVPGRQYRYRLRACDATECAPSLLSASVAASTDAAPAAPSDLGSAASPTGVTLSWTDNADSETRYAVSRREQGGVTWGGWATLVTLGANAGSYVDTTVVLDHRYRYRVRACNPVGCSGWATSPTASTTTSGTMAFSSRWSAAQGNTNPAHSDGGAWERLVCPLSGTRDKVLQVVSGSEAGWTRTPNVLRVTNRGQTGCGQVETLTRVPPGRSFYVRLFARVENENQPNFHPVTLNCCGRIETALWAIQNPTPGRSYQSRVMFHDPADAQVLWYSPVLDQKRWYRFEWFVEIVDPVAQTYRVWPRVYDMAGSLLHDAAGFRRGLSSGSTLADYYESGGVARYQDADLVRRFGVGYEGTGGSVDTGRRWYYADARVCLNGWCGGA